MRKIKSQLRPQRDMSNIQCYYCSENGHMQVRCKKIMEDLKKLKDMNKDGANSQANVVKSMEDGDDVFLAKNNEVAKTIWAMDSAASKHICRDREMFDIFKTNGEFNHFKLGNGEKMKVEGIGSVRMKLHDVVIRTFSNMGFVPSAIVNVIFDAILPPKGIG